MDTGVRGLGRGYVYLVYTWIQESGGWVEDKHHSIHDHQEHSWDSTYLDIQKQSTGNKRMS